MIGSVARVLQGQHGDVPSAGGRIVGRFLRARHEHRPNVLSAIFASSLPGLFKSGRWDRPRSSGRGWALGAAAWNL
jgi:hypothetical protein